MAAAEDDLRQELLDLQALLGNVERRLQHAKIAVEQLDARCSGDSLPQAENPSVVQSSATGSGHRDGAEQSPSADALAVSEQKADSDAAEILDEAALTPAQEALCVHLEHLHRTLQIEKVGPGPNEYAFLSKVRTVLSGAPEDLRPQRLLEVLTFCDRMAAPYLGNAFLPLHQAVQRARAMLQDCLTDYILLQAGGVGADIPGPRLPLTQSLVLATGVRTASGDELSQAMAVHPLSDTANAAVAAAWACCEDLYAWLWQGWRSALREDCDRGRDAVQAMLQSSADEHVRHLRNILNLHTRHGWAEESAALTDALAVLRAEGLRPLRITIGTIFDPEVHDHKRYDRVMRDAQAPSGTVIGLRQIGLLDATGLPVQKCIAVVAS